MKVSYYPAFNCIENEVTLQVREGSREVRKLSYKCKWMCKLFKTGGCFQGSFSS